ncbi:MAG TPA: cytochrome c peroxidase [Cyclobacteriaceae bacterium]|nr:cytochrome c peroxidase [Cyclobacteriaceae bacterium]
MRFLKITLVISILGLVLQSCNSDVQSTNEAHLVLPSTTDNYFVNINDEVPTLGRVLFYDNKLSVNNTISCSSCHKQSSAFADNVKFSRGFENRITLRNSMPIQNINVFSGVFSDGPVFGDPTTKLFWDGRESDLRTMVLRPIVNHIEMGITDVDQLAEKLKSVSYYKDLFTKAYGSDEITATKISDALSYFLQSIKSTNTKFDMANRFQDKLTALEMKGRQLFSDTYNCNSCHRVETPDGYAMAGGTFANIGLDPVYSDGGLANVTGAAADVGKFKIPSLRNVIFTAPYMHDGRFSTLEEVLDHYSSGIQDNPNLDSKLKSNGGPKQMNIPDDDRKAIIAFLNTLTDVQVLSDQKFSNPFKTN